MPQPAPSPPPPNPQSFAGLLAAFAAPQSSPGRKKPPARDRGGLDDDIATLSYERALRAHARYHAPAQVLAMAPQPDATDPTPQVQTEEQDAEPFQTQQLEPDQIPASWQAGTAAEFYEPLQFSEYAPASELHPMSAVGDENSASVCDESAAHPLAAVLLSSADQSARQDPPASAPAQRWHDAAPHTLADRNLKNASITIRLSQAECAQLRQRAAEAGLTVSAYMRSCTFETEALRALVKETLAKMRSEESRPNESRPHESRANQPQRLHAFQPRQQRGWWNWLTRLWPHARVSHSIGQA